LEKSSAGAGFANDVLDHQLAIMVLVIPAVDIDVFRVGMNVGHTGIRAASAIDSEIVAGFAPAHGADRVKSKLPCVHRRNLAGPGLLLVIREDFLCRLDHVEHLGPTFLNHSLAENHHLSDKRRNEDDGQNRNDQGEPFVDCKMPHPVSFVT